VTNGGVCLILLLQGKDSLHPDRRDLRGRSRPRPIKSTYVSGHPTELGWHTDVGLTLCEETQRRSHPEHVDLRGLLSSLNTERRPTRVTQLYRVG
jgi:hypothetical protein